MAEPRHAAADMRTQWPLFRPQLSLIKYVNKHENCLNVLAIGF